MTNSNDDVKHSQTYARKLRNRLNGDKSLRDKMH